MSILGGFEQFSRGERNGAIVLLLIIVSLTVYVFFSKQFVPEGTMTPEDYENLKSEYVIDSSQSHQPAVEIERKLFPFNPNIISLDSLQLLGFTEKEAGSIEKYRSKGGTFYKPSDFKKMYCVDDKTYAVLEDYIFIPVKHYDDKPEEQEYEEKPLVELNSASAEQLKTVKGIGEKLSARIIKTRSIYGGFTAVEELKLVYGLSDENYERIITQVYVNPDLMPGLNVNQAVAKDLIKHPHIHTWDIVNLIINERKQGGNYSDFEEFISRTNIADSIANNLKPYLKFQ